MAVHYEAAMITHAIIQIKSIREQLKNVGYDSLFIETLDNAILCKLHEVHVALYPFFSQKQLRKLCIDKRAIDKFNALLKYAPALKNHLLSADTQCHLISKSDGIARLGDAAEISQKLANKNFINEFMNVVFIKNGANLTLNYLADNFDFFSQRFSEEEIKILINQNIACPALVAIHQHFDRLYPVFGTTNIVKLASKTSNYLGMLTYLSCADRLSGKQFTFTEVLNILYVAESSKILEFILSEYDEFINLGLHHSDIVLIGQTPGAIPIFAAIKELYATLINSGFTHSQIISIAATQNGKLNLLTAKDTIQSIFITENNISRDVLATILSNQHGAKNYQVLVHYYSQLMTLGFDGDQIIEMFSNKNGASAAVAILECSDDIIDLKVSAKALLRIIKKEGGISTLKEFLNLYRSLIALQISPDFIYEKLTNKDYLKGLRTQIESAELATAIKMTQVPGIDLDIPSPTHSSAVKTLKRKKGEPINYPKKRASVIVKRNKLLSTECVLAAYQLMQPLCPKPVLSDKRIIVKIENSEAAILYQVIKKERDKMGILKISKYKECYHLTFNPEQYQNWAAELEVKLELNTNTQSSSTDMATEIVDNTTANLFSYNGTLEGTLFAPITDFNEADEAFLDKLPEPPNLT